MTARLSPTYLALLALALLLTLATAWPGLVYLWGQWQTNVAHNHGPAIVLLAVLFAWQKRAALRAMPFSPRWLAVAGLLPVLVFMVFARRAEIHVFVQYACWAALASLVVATVGWQGLKVLANSLVLLFLAIPLPGFMEASLTAELKLVSSRAGAALLQGFGIPVYVDGNVIDLGIYQLQVVDACSGLNYLIPLLAIGFIFAGFLRAPFWQRALIVAATVPITMLMNVVRIAVTGLLVRYAGPQAADGFLHDFEGWLIFLACVGLLIPLAALVLRTGSRPVSLGTALELDIGLGRVPPASVQRPAPRQLAVAVGLLVVAFASVIALGQRNEILPERKALTFFPRVIGEWVGTRESLSGGVIDMLQLSDYVLAQYRSPAHSEPVELYIGYHGSQRQGAMPHSPLICLPGGGWETLSLDRTRLELSDGRALPVNRAVMQVQRRRMLVVYWFRQRGADYANEYLMRAALFRDAVLEGRSDGALVRLITPIDTDLAAATARLVAFAERLEPVLPEYVPD
ncbi:MAG: VPLPA-CTERM-specific exosortase XrtD [Pseudomonadales bacterium]|nr:VPLPA-CTERM-specific exosortase XrtD [Pseudomonadales bacterium]